MEADEFQEAVVSLSFLIIIFSFILIVLTVNFTQIFDLEVNFGQELFILSIINCLLSIYFIIETLRIRKLPLSENENISGTKKRESIAVLFFIPHIIYFIIILIRESYQIITIVSSILIFLEFILICIIIKESYNIIIRKKRETGRN
ncbi:MAG: membrane protein of unknown function [Promethearchaeota archaeon]|nr:MAG: membrane protein of unknown function [Candidatus Lokiarchaeota archaeon]